MERKAKTTPPSKAKAIHFRVTPEMYEAIAADAAAAKQTVSEYCHNMALGRKIVVQQETVFDSEELLYVLGDMGKIGSNLNQIAHYLNGGGGPDATLRSEVMQAIIAIYKIRNMVREMAGEYRGNH